LSRPETPLLTVDIVITSNIEKGEPFVLIERKHPPAGWALPGGFVDLGETVEQAAIREAKEETSLDVTLTGLLGVYSDPGRDPRGHTVSVVFTATAEGELEARDDAKNAGWFGFDELPALAFDHAQILADYREWLLRQSLLY
jgi:8-oxo-dGTP diphosphatase